MTRYEHTQIGHVIICSLLAILLIASGGLIGHHAPPIIISIILLVCLVLFYRLKITIENETLCASFGPGIIRKRVRLAEIVRCEPIRIPWGDVWGIDMIPFGWLYNIFPASVPWRLHCSMAEKTHSAPTILTGSPKRSGLTSAIEFDARFIWHAIDADVSRLYSMQRPKT